MTQEQQKNNILETFFKELSIQINLDGLSFCIFNPVENYIEAMFNFPINFSKKTKKEIEEEITSILKNQEALKQDFTNIKVLHNTPIFSLIPKDLFSKKENAIEYLKYSNDASVFNNSLVEIDAITAIDTINLYVPDSFVNNIFIDFYGVFDYHHFSTALLKMLLKHYATQPYETMYVYSEQDLFYFVVFRNKKLYYFNRFDFETADDFLYYILFSIEQLKIDTEEVPLFIAGDISMNIEVYKRIKKYIKYIFLMRYETEYYAKGISDELIRKNFVVSQFF